MLFRSPPTSPGRPSPSPESPVARWPSPSRRPRSPRSGLATTTTRPARPSAQRCVPLASSRPRAVATRPPPNTPSLRPRVTRAPRTPSVPSADSTLTPNQALGGAPLDAYSPSHASAQPQAQDDAMMECDDDEMMHGGGHGRNGGVDHQADWTTAPVMHHQRESRLAGPPSGPYPRAGPSSRALAPKTQCPTRPSRPRARRRPMSFRTSLRRRTSRPSPTRTASRASLSPSSNRRRSDCTRRRRARSRCTTRRTASGSDRKGAPRFGPGVDQRDRGMLTLSRWSHVLVLLCARYALSNLGWGWRKDVRS